MNVWRSESHPSRQSLLSIACAVVGLVLTVAFRDGSVGTDAMAGFVLGLILLVIGVVGFLTSGKQTVVVDPRSRQITVEDSNRFGTKRRLIPFDDIVSVGIGYLGKKSNFVTWYYLVLKLSSGEAYPLFSPGRFYEGGSDRSVVDSWRRRLEEYVGSDNAA